jgi:hypothetical protein
MLSGLILTALAPVGPLSLPDALGLDPVGRDMSRAAAAEPPSAFAPSPQPSAQATEPAPRPRPLLAMTTPAKRILPDPEKGPQCDATQRPGRKARYNGKSVSQLYDKVFRPGPEIPHLDGWIPQGLTVWRDWDGKGNTLVLIGMYRQNAKSFIVGVNPRTGRHVGTVRVKASHLGALGVSGKWLLAQDAAEVGQQPALRRYTLTKLRAKMQRSAATSTKPYMAQYGKTQKVHGASYMFVEDDNLWIGRYARSINPKMYRYAVDDDGIIHQKDGPWRVPRRTQGVMVTQDHFVFTSSLGGERGRMIVTRRAAPGKLEDPVACLWTPSLPQNMTVYQGRMLTAYESGAARFDKKTTRNKISHLHVGSVEQLIRIADPASLQAFYAPAAPVEETDDMPQTPEEVGSYLVWGASPDRAAEAIARHEGRATAEPMPDSTPEQTAPEQTAPGQPAPEQTAPAPEQDALEHSTPSPEAAVPAPQPAPEQQAPEQPAPAPAPAPDAPAPADPEFGLEEGDASQQVHEAPNQPVDNSDEAPERISDARVMERWEHNPYIEPSRPASIGF